MEWKKYYSAYRTFTFCDLYKLTCTCCNLQKQFDLYKIWFVQNLNKYIYMYMFDMSHLFQIQKYLWASVYGAAWEV